MPDPYDEISESGCVVAGISETALYVSDNLRLLWEQHVYWTRLVILGIIFDLPDLEQTTSRLLRNVPDFERVFNHFYGKEVSDEFGRLLKDHLVIAAELVKEAKAGNSKAAEAAERRWYGNADEIVCFLNSINSNWTIEHGRAMWHEHLALTKEEAVDTLKRNYKKSIITFNKIEQAALMMADDFSQGIILQFDL
ncbi:MAG: hypothetical protein H6Q74_978 [Firmicutes bacterium]|nr:hypothetical protein [Bacillota bacterium]